MGSGLIKIKRRIASIDSTRKITNAMELVSTVKLQRKKKDLQKTVDYTAMLSGIILSCLKGMDESQEDVSSLIGKSSKPTRKNNLYVVITSSLGLCGGYNLNIMKYLNEFLSKDDEVMMIGTKGLSKYDKKDIPLDDSNVSFLDAFSFGNVKKLRGQIQELFEKKEYKSIYLVYTHFKNALTFVPDKLQLLPLDHLEPGKEDKGFPPIFCPTRKEVFSLLIPKYLDSILYERITESMVCEQGSRRNAMENATDNADDLHDRLNLEYNKARQAEITSQITEIMSGRLED